MLFTMNKCAFLRTLSTLFFSCSPKTGKNLIKSPAWDHRQVAVWKAEPPLPKPHPTAGGFEGGGGSRVGVRLFSENVAIDEQEHTIMGFSSPFFLQQSTEGILCNNSLATDADKHNLQYTGIALSRSQGHRSEYQSRNKHAGL